MTVKWMIHMCMLGLCSIQDWKEKEISVWKIAVYLGLVAVYGAAEVTFENKEISAELLRTAAGCIPGMALLAFGKLSGGAVGCGDGILTVVIGMSLGFWETMGILMTALTAAFGAGMILLVREKNIRNRQMAFVPFLFLGTAGAGLWMGG